MNILKGFITINSLANNTAGQVGQFGELSTYSRTFSREIGNYVNSAQAHVQLETFHSVTDIGAFTVLTTPVKNHILQVGQWIRDQYATNSIPSNASKTSFINTQLAVEFPNMANITIGELVEHTTDNLKHMPDYIQWEYTDTANGDTVTQIKVWFIDSAFRNQYDEFEIIIVPPLVDIEDFENTTAVVGPLLALQTNAVLVDKINTAMGTKPPTMVKTEYFTWHDPTDPPASLASTLQTTWTFLIYGPAGNNMDNIRAAMQDYIDAIVAPTVAPETWVLMFPDLYSETEFTIIPLWDRFASPETVMDYGLYSPTVNPADMKAIALTFTPPNYSGGNPMGPYLDTNLNLSQSVYRSLAFLAVGNALNSGGIIRFLQRFPDYMALPPVNADFARMELETQNFIILLMDMLDKAQTLTPTSPVPSGYTRVPRNGKYYLAKPYLDTVYLVLSKYSFDNA